jgi:hypothetical protein
VKSLQVPTNFIGMTTTSANIGIPPFRRNLFMVYDFPAPISPAVKTNHVGSVCEILAGADEFHRYDNNECQHWNPPFRTNLFMVYDFPAPISPAMKTNHVGSVGYYMHRHCHCQ